MTIAASFSLKENTLCFITNCKDTRAIHVPSNDLESFTCKHVEMVVGTDQDLRKPSYAVQFEEGHLTDSKISEEMKSIQDEDSRFPTVLVVKVSDKAYASNPVGYTHVKVEMKSSAEMPILHCTVGPTDIFKLLFLRLYIYFFFPTSLFSTRFTFKKS